MGVDMCTAVAAAAFAATIPIKSEDKILRKCLKNRDEIRAEKHPGMNEIPPFFHNSSGTAPHSSIAYLKFAATFEIRWLRLCSKKTLKSNFILWA